MPQFTGNGFSVNAEFWNRIAKREPFFGGEIIVHRPDKSGQADW
jgi:hypothetical protein